VPVRGAADGGDDTPKPMAMEVTRSEIHAGKDPPVRLRVKAGALTDEGRPREVRSPQPCQRPVCRTLIGPDKEKTQLFAPRQRVPLRSPQQPLRRVENPLRTGMYRLSRRDVRAR
jgi:hypothetical protein